MFSPPAPEWNPEARRALGGPAAVAGENPPYAGSSYYSAGPASLLDPVFILRTIWAFRWLAVLTAILGIVLASFIALSIPKTYTATSQVLVDPRDIKVVQNEVTPNGLPSEATLALIESQIAVVYSNALLSRVIEEAGLADDTEFNGKSTSPFAFITDLIPTFGDETAKGETRLRTLKNFRKELKVDRDPKSFVINIAVTSEDPEKAARLSRLVASTFMDEMGRVQSGTARKASAALSGRLSELRQTVADAERAVEDYKAKNQLVGVGGQLVDDNYISRINDQLSRGRADIASLRVRADQMKKAGVEDVVKGTLPEELTSEALTKLRQSYSDLAQQKAILSATLGRRHPQRIANEEALTAGRTAIRGELGRIVAAAQTELSRAQQTNADLTKQLADLKSKQIDTSSSFVKLRELEREVDASRAVYEAFLLRARETGEQETLNTSNVRVISEATPPLEPSSLSRRLIVAAGGLLGLLIGIGIAVLVGIGRLFREISKGRSMVEARQMPRRSAYAGGTGLVPYGQTDPSPYRGAPAGAGPNYGPMTTRGSLSIDDSTLSRRSGEHVAAAASRTEESFDNLRPSVAADAAGQRRERSPVEPEVEEPMPPTADGGSAAPPAEGFDDGEQEAQTLDPSDGMSQAPESGAEVGNMPTARRSLRDRVKAIAAERGTEGASAALANDPEVTRLQKDIAEAKRHIASIRSRRLPR